MSTGSEKREWLIEASVAVLQGSPRRELNAVSFNKALFYLDLLALRDRGAVVTGHRYMALPQGPVLARFAPQLVRTLKRRGLAEQVSRGRAKPIKLIRSMSSFERLDEWAVAMAEHLGGVFSSTTSARASAFSHENLAWKRAYDHGLGGGGAAKTVNMVLAMQQLLGDDDPWLDEEPNEETLHDLSLVGRVGSEAW